MLRRAVVFLAAVAAASAFSLAPAGISQPYRGSNTRHARAGIKMMDAGGANYAVDLLAAAPGIAALAVLIDRGNQKASALTVAAEGVFVICELLTIADPHTQGHQQFAFI
jgi:hypothetical protein